MKTQILVVKNLDRKLAEIKAKGEKTRVDWRARSRQFRNSTGSLCFDPVTGKGHSYDWYCISQVIKGELYLNTYSYSSTTRRQVSQLHSLFRQLKVKYREIEAPLGLQNLEAIKSHALSEFGKLTVENTYAISQGTNALYHIERAREIGLTFTRKELKAAAEAAELARKARLEKQKIRRKELLFQKKTAPVRLDIWEQKRKTEIEVSPNFVAAVAQRLGVRLTSEEIVQLSDSL